MKLPRRMMKRLGVWEYGRVGVRPLDLSHSPTLPHSHTPIPPYPHTHGRHLYVIRVAAERRAEIFGKLREMGIGVNVHYIPIHLHPFYRERFGTGPGMCPVAEAAYEELISLPMHPAMTDADVATVIDAVRQVIS